MQVPVDVPANVCGDSVNVVGVGNTAAHNTCANHGAPTSGGAVAAGGSGNGTTAGGSPGLLSGNSLQIPVTVPVNACGDSVNVIGIGNTAAHNSCANHGSAVAAPPPVTTTTAAPPPAAPPSTPVTTTPGTTVPRTTGGEPVGDVAQPAGATGSLAHTGADGLALAPIGAAMIGGGAFLYRKFKPRGSH
ncbi:chaplin [Catenulispora yoronensis]